MSTDPLDHRLRRERLRAGDHDAFGALYRDHVTAVFNLAHRMTGSRSLAEDVTSETFLAAWRGRASVEVDDRPLQAWLLGIAANQSLNATRGVRRRLAFLGRRPAPGAVADFADEAVGRIDDARLLARTQQALAGLSRHEAEVIGLCVWSGLSYGEVADALGVPVGTVRSRLNRARRRLRELTAEPATPSRTTTQPMPGAQR